MFSRSSFKLVAQIGAVVGILGLASAASATGGTNTIVDITIEGSNHARISLAGGAIGGRPACHNSGYTTHYQWDISSTRGRALLAAVQAAQLAGKRVTTYGSTSCTTGVVSLETLSGLTVWTN